MQQAEKIQKHPRFDSTVDGQVALYCAVPLGGRRPPCCAVDGNGVSTRSSRLPQLGDVRSARGAAQHGGWRPLDFFRPFPQFDHLGNASIGYASAVCSFSRPSWIDDDVSR